MYKTKNDIPEKTRAALVELLNARLADSVDLMHQAKEAHWNVKGPSFIALHKLFDEVGPRYSERPGGYTRIVKLGPRRSDSTEMVYLELV